MNCPRCKAPISMQLNRCNQCGQSIQVYNKVIARSNAFYNIGLEKAKVRDLSGAIAALNESLKYYKGNVDARNLLGLVYYEMGEIVPALAQWILSKNVSSEKNEADTYINSIQTNPNQLESVNLTIKKYNSALLSAKQRSEDLAIIQLKKVVSLNPNFVKAQHLLALLYMMTGENELAIRCLKHIKKIDINNTTTIRYLKELGAYNKNDEVNAAATTERKVFHGDANVTVKAVGSYKKEKPRAFQLINVLVGVAIGLFVTLVLLVPTIESKLSGDKSSEITDYGTKLADKDSQITSLKYENGNLQAQIERLEEQLNEANEDDSLPAADVYKTILSAYKDYNEGNMASALSALIDIDLSQVDSKDAKDVVELIQNEDVGKASGDVFEQGRVAYNSGKYEEALDLLQEALELDKDNFDAIYFLGRLYHKQGDKEKAQEYYSTVVTDYPDSPRASEASAKLRELGVVVD